MSRRYQRYAFADERRDEADDEVIDRSFVEERSDQLAAAHHPHILSGLSAHLFSERMYRLRYETDADGDRWRGRLTREHVVHVICAEVRPHLDTQVECLSTENLRVHRAHEFWQTVETFRRRTIRQPVDVAVRSSDVTISARRDVNDCPVYQTQALSEFRSIFTGDVIDLLPRELLWRYARRIARLAEETV
jgi:hypothetical protein